MNNNNYYSFKFHCSYFFQDDFSPKEKDKIMNASFPYLKLAHYRNQLLNWYVPESMFLLCLLGHHERKLSEIRRLFATLSKALSREFVLPQIPTNLVRISMQYQ